MSSKAGRAQIDIKVRACPFESLPGPKYPHKGRACHFFRQNEIGAHSGRGVPQNGDVGCSRASSPASASRRDCRRAKVPSADGRFAAPVRWRVRFPAAKQLLRQRRAARMKCNKSLLPERHLVGPLDI